MNSPLSIYCQNTNILQNVMPFYRKTNSDLKFSKQNERKILKAFLLGQLYQLFCDLFKCNLPNNQNSYSTECYSMDSKIIKFLIHGIIDTGDYTLEGIAYHTHIPFDIIYDAACGFSSQFSVISWAKIADLYLQVKPDVGQVLAGRLIEMKDKNHLVYSSLLKEKQDE